MAPYRRSTQIDASSSNANNASNATNNASLFKEDAELKRLLKVLVEEIHSKKEFDRWRKSFLNRIEETVADESGMQAAAAAYGNFQETVQRMGKVVHNVECLIGSGALTADSATVKARNCLGELKATTIVMNDVLASLLRGGGGGGHQNYGYTNYHMGAVLVGDGFSVYSLLTAYDEILSKYQMEVLQHIADKQILAEIDNYKKKVGIFSDVMADLGLKDAMKKTRQILLQVASPAEEDKEEALLEKQNDDTETGTVDTSTDESTSLSSDEEDDSSDDDEEEEEESISSSEEEDSSDEEEEPEASQAEPTTSKPEPEPEKSIDIAASAPKPKSWSSSSSWRGKAKRGSMWTYSEKCKPRCCCLQCARAKLQMLKNGC